MSFPSGSGALWASAVAVGGVLLALFASEEGCGNTDGSFTLDDPQADPTEYCEATDFPGFPDSIGSMLLVGAVYLGPALVLLLGLFLSRRVGRQGFRGWTTALAVAWFVLAALLSFAAANVGYEGSV